MVAVLIILFGGGLLLYDKANVQNLKKEYEVYRTGMFETYKLIGEDDTYFVVSWHSFMDALNYAFIKEGVQGLKSSYIGKDIYLCGTKGEHIVYGNPVEIKPIIIDGQDCFPIKGSIEQVVRCHTEEAFLSIIVGIAVLIIYAVV